MRPVRWNRKVIWTVAGIVGAAAAIVLVVHLRHWRPHSITFQGAVIRRDTDVRKEVPIADALITASDGAARATTFSGASGYFKITLHEPIWPGATAQLGFNAPGYKPLGMTLHIGLHSNTRELYIAELEPIAVRPAAPGHPPVAISNVRIRYTVNYQTDTNIGTAVKTFQVVNNENVPCSSSALCSPHGLWKAAAGSIALSAGAGNLFRNVRAFCIAGPCPFTRIDLGGSPHDAQSVVVTATDWSGTATFLVEAEVFHQTIASNVRESYPVIYGRDLHFTLPPTAEGPSIEAEIDGSSIVFPLGTGLYMSWAVCGSRRTGSGGEDSTIYQCTLKPGYRF